MDKICNYVKVRTLNEIIPHKIAEILINLVKVMFPAYGGQNGSHFMQRKGQRISIQFS